MTKRSVYLPFFLFAVLCLFMIPAAGQETTGGIVGVVKDSSGSTVAGARITAVNEETDLESQAVSDETGGYQFPLLRAGRYRLAVTAPGFQKLLRPDVIVNTTERVHLDLTLLVGGVNETVTVTGETPLLQSEKATVGQVVEQRAMDTEASSDGRVAVAERIP